MFEIQSHLLLSVMPITSPPETYHSSHHLIKHIRFRHKTQASAKSKAFRWFQIKYTHLAEEKHPCLSREETRKVQIADLAFSPAHGMVTSVQKPVLTHEFNGNCQTFPPKIMPLPVFSSRCIRLQFSGVVWAAEENKGSLLAVIICKYY